MGRSMVLIGQGKGPEGMAWDDVAVIQQDEARQGRAGQGRAGQVMICWLGNNLVWEDFVGWLCCHVYV